MEAVLRSAVEAALAARDGRPATVVAARPVGGGCIHRARLLELADGRRLFLKSGTGVPEDLFAREAEGLAALAAVGPLRVPRETLAGAAGQVRFLLMEAIAAGRPPAGFFAAFGRGLAELHRRSRGTRCGFDHDNYLGATPQPNPWSDSWPAFFRDRRIGHLLGLARRRGPADPELARLGERLLGRLDELLAGSGGETSLLHGDLWSGNFLADEAGAAVLVDPAAHRGHREAELAMCRLFGGFEPSFYAAYEEVWPSAPGHAERLPLYQLYHLLNHLLLFGGSYREDCLAILRRYAG